MQTIWGLWTRGTRVVPRRVIDFGQDQRPDCTGIAGASREILTSSNGAMQSPCSPVAQIRSNIVRYH